MRQSVMELGSLIAVRMEWKVKEVQGRHRTDGEIFGVMEVSYWIKIYPTTTSS